MDQQVPNLQLQQQQNQETIKKIQHYLFNWSDKIGTGSFSEVYRAINQKNQQEVAIKVIKNESIKSKTAQRLLNHQISILKCLDHPNLIKSHDVFSSLNNCYIITEYCPGGDLQKILKKRKTFLEQQISKIAFDTFKGLQYLNHNFIIHRDFKIANIFLKDDSYKIADFGFAIRSKSLFTDIPVGSPIYMSPQGLVYNNYGPKTDVWSFGVMLYQLLHGQAPLDKCKTEEELKINILKKPQIRAKVSKQLKHLIQKCLQTNLSERFSISQIKQTQYMKKVFAIYETQKMIPQALTSTYYSSQSNNSILDTFFEGSFSYDEALSILHYCRFLHKTAVKTGSKQFSNWLLIIFEAFSHCKITKSGKKPKQKNENIPDNLKNIIQEYYQKYKAEHKISNQLGMQHCDFNIIQTECTNLYKQYEKNSNLTDLKNMVFMLYKETQLLNQSFKTQKISYFAKHSQSRDFLSKIGKIPSPEIQKLSTQKKQKK